MTTLMWIVPIIGIVALLVAAVLAANVKKQSEGTDKMKEIAAAAIQNHETGPKS